MTGLPDASTVLAQLGYQEPTQIQQNVIDAWQQHVSIVGFAPTGSGKTLAFVLGAMHLLDPQLSETQVIVLCPTRELVQQVAETWRSALRTTPGMQVVVLIGGEPVGGQIKSLKGPSHVVVGTPGRVLDHCQRKRLDLQNIRVRVLDEADRMLDMGMREQVEEIMSFTPAQCHTGFFSATSSATLMELTKQWMSDPAVLDVRTETSQPDIEQTFFEAQADQKFNALCALLTEIKPVRCIVFCEKKSTVSDIGNRLVQQGFCALALHSDLDQTDRTKHLIALKLGAANVLIATDVAARGLDLPEIDVVINLDLAGNLETHIHRIGRSGRAGQSGKAITLISPSEAPKLLSWFPGDAMPSVSGINHLRFHRNRILETQVSLIEIKGGKKDKLRKGDLVGALIQQGGLTGDDITGIELMSTRTFLAIKKRSTKAVLRFFKDQRIKGKRFRATKF